MKYLHGYLIILIAKYITVISITAFGYRFETYCQHFYRFTNMLSILSRLFLGSDYFASRGKIVPCYYDTRSKIAVYAIWPQEPK